MKMNSALVERTLDQYEAQALPENHPEMAQLYNLFGMHTFFIDDEGLSIVERIEPEDGAGETGQVVKLASWVDDKRTRLAPHEPEPRELTVKLASN